MVIPRHIHGEDCLYFVISGHAVMGSKRLGAGDGFFVPAHTSYAYRAGEEGVEVLEFRHAAVGINTTILDTAPVPWELFLDTVRTNKEAWRAEEVPPAQRGRP
jgi:hypothetical protein